MVHLWTYSNTLRCIKKPRELLQVRRFYSTRPPPERVTLPCQSNGSIDLDVHPSPNQSPAQRSPSTVAIYLPRGPLFNSERDDAATMSTLRSNLSCPIVQINYRLSSEERYPIPVFDVLAGYDWVVRNLLPKRAISRAGRAENVGSILVCGELIGGGLATALALTECRVGEPGVVAAAISNPVMDWVSVGQPSEISGRKSKKAASTTVLESAAGDKELLALRTQLFKRPQDYFDPFASPILFFRSAGVEVPPEPATVPLDEMDHLSILEREDFYQQEIGEDPLVTPSITQEAPTKSMRKTSRRFPSKALGLRLPSFHITSGITSPLNGQATEFTKLLRQSIIRQGEQVNSESHSFGRKVLLEEEEQQQWDDMNSQERESRMSQQRHAEDKARFSMYEDLGLWDSSTSGMARINETAEWLQGHVQ